MNISDLSIGNVYTNNEIMDAFECAFMGGMRRSKKTNTLVLVCDHTKRLSDDKYLFKDKTGEMVVEIDYKYWAGLQVDEKNILELTGKVDRDYNAVSLDVFLVKKIK